MLKEVDNIRGAAVDTDENGGETMIDTLANVIGGGATKLRDV